MLKVAPHTASDRAATLVLIFAIPAAFVLLCLGWHRIALGTFPNAGQFAAWALAAFIACGAIALARAVASERVRLKSVKSRSARDHTWMAYFALLLFISATGALSSFIYYAEGTTVVSESIASCEDCLKRLQSTTELAVETNVYNELRNNVQRIQSAIEIEIINKRNCGDGPAVIGLIRNMQDYLPSYRRPTGRIPNCDPEQIDGVVNLYRQQRDQQLPLSDAYRTDRVAEKAAVRSDLSGVMERNRTALNSATDVLAKESVNGLASARTIVEKVVNDMEEFSLRVRNLSAAVEWSCKINLQDARGLGSFWQIFGIVRSRLDRVSTQGYIFFAIVIDCMLVMFFARVIRGAPDDTGEDPPDPDSPTPPVGLWGAPR
jgi:hypothetical protein